MSELILEGEGTLLTDDIQETCFAWGSIYNLNMKKEKASFYFILQNKNTSKQITKKIVPFSLSLPVTVTELEVRQIKLKFYFF